MIEDEILRRFVQACPDPEDAEARIRAILVDEFQRAEQPLPEWLQGPRSPNVNT